MEKTCCVTGHRVIPEDKREYVDRELKKAVEAAVTQGYGRFISGFADGVDLTFAAIVAGLKEQGRPVTLEAAIPNAGRLKYKAPAFQNLLAACDGVTVLCETYSPNCFFIRNRYMVDQSGLVIAVHDGREKGGTAYTIHYARTQGKEVHIIKI